MTFPHLPHRPSSEDDALDQALNAWVTDANHEPASDLADDALEFHRWANETRRTEPAATGPAAGTWNRVLLHVEQKSPKGTPAMSSGIFSAANDAVIDYEPRSLNRRDISRFVNIAATVAIVFAVTVGGWLAMSQLPPGGDGRFAALQGTPEVAQSQTCDVESLIVDEVMAIVDNPYSVAPLDTWGTPAPGDEGVSLAGEGLREPPAMLSPLPESASTVPNEAEFERIQEAADQYLACSFSGTVGQLMAILHPTQIQSYVLSNFPVYRDRAEVRTFVEDAIDQEARGMSPAFRPMAGEIWPTYQMSQPTTERTRVRITMARNRDLLEDQLAFVGLDYVDADSDLVGSTDWDATVLEGDFTTTNGGVALIMVYAEATDTWYFYGYNAPRG